MSRITRRVLDVSPRRAECDGERWRRTRFPSWRAASVLALAAALCTPACGGAPDADADAATSTATLIVSAASSLTTAFERAAEAFERANPGVDVVLNVDGSSALVTQVLEGAPVDVFAAADAPTMDRLVDAGLVDGTPRTFATNELVIVTPPANPAGIDSPDDIANPADAGVIALCGTTVPCGRYAGEALAAAGVRIDESRVTRTPNVRAALAAVVDGDAVAAVVYRTDARSAGDAVRTVALPPGRGDVVTYPIAALSRSTNPSLASAFVEWILGPAGQATLADLGFGPAP